MEEAHAQDLQQILQQVNMDMCLSHNHYRHHHPNTNTTTTINIKTTIISSQLSRKEEELAEYRSQLGHPSFLPFFLFVFFSSSVFLSVLPPFFSYSFSSIPSFPSFPSSARQAESLAAMHMDEKNVLPSFLPVYLPSFLPFICPLSALRAFF